MSLINGRQNQLQSSERGSILIMTAVGMLVMFLMVGLCIDVSRIYMARAEMQNAADAAALSAARELNSGAAGIDAAVTRANAIVNTRANGQKVVSIAKVEFATDLNGTYWDSATDLSTAKANAANIRFVRVTTQSTLTSILFALSAKNGLGPSHTESRQAVAGMSIGINTVCDFFPVAVALTTKPAPNARMTLLFKQGDPGANTLVNTNYVILEVPGINGNGERETVELAAGVANICTTLHSNIKFTPSSNKNNGRKAIGWGANSRFDNPGKNYIDAATYPPDTNVASDITFDQYLKKNPFQPPLHPGQDERRILIVPIIAPGTYDANVGAPTTNLGAFFLRSQIPSSGDLDVEWIDETLVIGRGGFAPCGGTTTLTVPVLYR